MHGRPSAFGKDFMRLRIDQDISLTNGNFILIPKYGRNLFQWFPASIRVKEPHYDGQKETWNDQTEVELPTNVCKGSRRGLKPNNIRQREGGNTETDAL